MSQSDDDDEAESVHNSFRKVLSNRSLGLSVPLVVCPIWFFVSFQPTHSLCACGRPLFFVWRAKVLVVLFFASKWVHQPTNQPKYFPQSKVWYNQRTSSPCLPFLPGVSPRNTRPLVRQPTNLFFMCNGSSVHEPTTDPCVSSVRRPCHCF